MTTLFVVAWTIAVGSWILAMIEWPSHVAFRASCLWVGPSSLGPGREAAAASVAQRLGGREDDGEVRSPSQIPVCSGRHSASSPSSSTLLSRSRASCGGANPRGHHDLFRGLARGMDGGGLTFATTESSI